MALDDLLVCPVCRTSMDLAKLRQTGHEQCVKCRFTFSFSSAYNFIPSPPPDPDVRQPWDLWQRLQENGLASYSQAPEENLAVGDREDAKSFREYCALQGTVLDIGCGPQEFPSYGKADNVRFVGIDPLIGIQPRKFEFVQALAEYLPFRDQSFDRVLFATSLDHVLSPQRSVLEACRVLKPNGKVLIWYGEDHHGHESALRKWGRRTKKALKLITRGQFSQLARKVKRRLSGSNPAAGQTEVAVPEGAVDHYHLCHLTDEKIAEWLSSAGLEIHDTSRVSDAGVFLRVGKRPSS